MATNTTVLIVVAAMSALLLAGMLAGVAYKTRTQQRHVKGGRSAIRPSRTHSKFGIKMHSPTSPP